ncbi:serine/threonine-protein kinase [Streptomyces sp. NPDC017993]|uniref:serine/threonine-protein kinase n=1 Tax=Streptomyces sp. NPDC017993 TaxID=3365027 RepID=UPI0037AE1C82
MQQPGRAEQQGQAGRSGGPAPLRERDPQRIGEYRLIGRLGEGGMGQVFLARSDRGRTVAVKLVRAELADQEEFRARFRQEVRAALRVGGEWTAPVLDADTEAATPWVATGYIAGPSLQQVVAGSAAPLPERTVRILAAGLARALQAIHAAGIIHRDLKPSNVLLTIDGPRVIDFGIARALEAVTGNGLTRTGAAVGSPGFMAPEQVRGEALTPACDVFCLGSVLAYAATGRQPFGTADSGVHAMLYRIAQEEPDLTALPAGLHDLVAACLAKDPAQRPTPAELLALTETPDGSGGEGGGADDEPWLPGALVARLGRHAVELLEAENPKGGTDGAGSRLAPPATPSAARAAPGVHGLPTAVSPAAAATPPPSPVPQGPASAQAPASAYGYPYAAGGQGTPPPAHPGHGPYGPGLPAPASAAPAPRRGSGTALMVAVALVLAGAGAATAYVLMEGKGGGARAAAPKDDRPSGKGGTAEEEQGTAGEGQGSAEPAGDGGIPADYLGTWETTVGGSSADVRRFRLTQGGTGDTVLTMTATGPAYHCEFAATLDSAGPPVRLGPSTVTSGPAESCRPGTPSTLEMVDGKLRRTFDDGKAPLTYDRAR